MPTTRTELAAIAAPLSFLYREAKNGGKRAANSEITGDGKHSGGIDFFSHARIYNESFFTSSKALAWPLSSSLSALSARVSPAYQTGLPFLSRPALDAYIPSLRSPVHPLALLSLSLVPVRYLSVYFRRYNATLLI